MNNRTVSKFFLVALVLLFAATVMASQIHIRGSSGNGVNSNAPQWLLLGRTRDLVLTGNGKQATMRREIVCLDQDVVAAQSNPIDVISGSCQSGTYMYVVQLQANATNLSMTLGKLVGFDPTNTDNFGVMICDSSSNTIELCTNDPTGTHIPNITATTSTTSVTFTVPGAFPSYAGGTAQQGKGLTFYVITQQSTALPIGLPTVAIQ